LSWRRTSAEKRLSKSINSKENATMRRDTKEAAVRPEAIEGLEEIGLPLEELIRRGARKII
jgi:hypothetical protein